MNYQSTSGPTRRSGAGRRPTVAPDLLPISTDGSLSLARRVYDVLRTGLMAGAILPGDPLTSRSLSTALQVSPTPVREALKQLEADGALTSRNKSAFYVNNPDRIEFEQILEIRLELEGLAIRKAALVAKKTDLVPIAAINKSYQTYLGQGGEGPTLSLVPNFQFHFEIYRLSGSQILVDMIEATWSRIGPALHSFMMKYNADLMTTVYHDRMIAALSENDPEAAEAALHGDLIDASKVIHPTLKVGSAHRMGTGIR